MIPRYSLPEGFDPNEIPRDWFVVARYGPEVGPGDEISYDVEGRSPFGGPLIRGVKPYNRKKRVPLADIYAADLMDPAFVSFDGVGLRFFIHEESVQTAECGA